MTIADITEGRFHGDFAGLSACKTAVGGVDLLDEAITLAAALHYTGYRHVVAALWSVDNETSSEVFASLYCEIATDGRLEPDRAPCRAAPGGARSCVTGIRTGRTGGHRSPTPDPDRALDGGQ